jgi:serine protease Do
LKDHVERPGEETSVKRWVTVESAESADFRIGDVIEKVGDVEVNTTIDVERGFLDRGAAPVPVIVKRAGDKVKIEVTMQAIEKAPMDLVQRRLGLKLTPVAKEIVARVDSQLRGGLNVNEVLANSAAAKAGLQRGDIVIGFHQWEAVNVDNVIYVLNHKDLATFSPVKAFFIRDGKVRETALTPGD